MTWKGETHHTVDAKGQANEPQAINHPAVLHSALIVRPGAAPPANHASTIVEVWPGRFIAAWFAGTAEGNPDVGILSASYTEKSGWSKTKELVTPHGVPSYNPVLTKLHNGQVLLFYKVGRSVARWRGFLMRSHDNGTTWEAPEMLPSGVYGPTKNKCLQLRDGTLLCPSSDEKSGRGLDSALGKVWTCAVDETRDGGVTWSHHGPIAMNGAGIIQPALYLDSQGNVRMVMRTRGARYMATVASDGGGVVWAAPSLTSVPNPNSALDVTRLADGRLLLVYNHSFKTRRAGRGVLVVALSTDDGASWSRVLTLEDSAGRTQEFSYPAVIQAGNGDVHITYTWQRLSIRHVVLDPSKLVIV